MVQEKIIEIKTGDAIKSIQDLKNNISAYKEQLAGLEIGTKEYQNTLKSLQENQAALRNAMYGTTASLQDVMNAATAANVAFDDNNKLVKAETLSYNELVRELAILKEEWRSSSNEAERAQLGERIDAVNDRLKEMDASVGVFGRNVGNYIGAVDHLTAGLSGMGSGASKLIGPLKGVTAGLKTMSATPAIAILGVLATVLDKIIKELRGTEEGVNAMTASMAPFAAIGDTITKILQGLGIALAKVVGWMGDLTRAIIGNNEAAQKRLELAQNQAELDASMRERMVQDAKDAKTVAELRAKASERLTYTAKERLEFLQEAGRLEGEISKRGVEDARKQYEIIVARNAMSKSGKAELDEEARAYADMIKAETSYYVQLRQINQGITRARKELIKEERDAAKAVRDAATAKINAEKEYLSQLLSIVRTGTESELKLQNEVAKKEYELAVANARQKISNRDELNRSLSLLEKSYQVKLQKNQQDHDNKVLAEELRSIANRRDAMQKGSVEYATLEKEYAAAALDGLKRQMDESDAAFKSRQLEAQRNLAESQARLQDALLKETVDGLTAQMAATREGSVEQLSLALEVAKAKVDGIYQGIDESLDAFNARRLAAEREVRKAEDALEEGRVSRDRVILEQRMALLEEGSTQYLTLAMELKQFELDSLHQLEGESEDEFRLRQLQAEKEYLESKRSLWEANLSIMQQAAGSVTSILGTIAEAYESNTNATRAEVQKAKNLRIAGATIDMLQGAVTAYSSAQSLGVPMGPIMGALNAAAVVATGLLNISKIRATQVSTASASTATPSVPAQVSAPAVQPEVNNVRTITSASEEDRLNQMVSDQRVYILESDLEASENQRRVEVAETTF